MNYALINNNIVVNIIYLHSMNAGDFAAVPMDDLPVQIGDEYIDGEFYRDGRKLKDIVTPEQTNKYGISDTLLDQIKDDTVTEIEEAVINGTD